ncbi:MAG: hypothetical protein L6Q63_17520 [Giesbergeria sp.]|nr:hypothetical protein [Giesbergeria sp.]
MQQLADSTGVSRRLLFQAAAVHRYGCPELVKAAHAGLLAMKHCETLAKALPHDQQREFLAELSSMTPRQRHDLLGISMCATTTGACCSPASAWPHGDGLLTTP